MKYTQLGTADMRVSSICFGGAQLVDHGKYGSTKKDAIDAVRHALDLGINFFDTSEWYGQGEGERLLAEALGADRHRVHIATKVGLHEFEGRGIRDSRPDRIVEHIDLALARLETDYVDLYQIHWPDPYVPFEESWEAMCRVQDSGKARYIGVSNYGSDQMLQCLEVSPVHSLQACYHMFRRELEEDQLPFCREHRIGVMIWGPLAHGLLTGKFGLDNPPNLQPGDWRLQMPIMHGEGFRQCAQVIRRLEFFARERGYTMTELAIAWTLVQPGIDTVITGSRKPEHLDAQVRGVDWELSPEERAHIEAVLACGASWRALGGEDEYGGHDVIPVDRRPALVGGDVHRRE